MNNKKKILFLFTELSGYIINSFEYALSSGFDIHIVNYPVNKGAPFKFTKNKNIYYYGRDEFKSSYDLSIFIKNLKPGAIFISGWVDKSYLNALRNLSIKFKKILMLDNPWRGTLQQNLWAFCFKLYYRSIFNCIWIPGKPQLKYAIKLGFKKEDIFEGLYTCNNKIFNLKNTLSLTNKFKVLLFVGRYSEEKGIKELWQNFVSINSTLDSKWQLWCVGTGNLWDNRKLDKNIKHFGFVQQEKIIEIISKAYIFVLPSKYEPWGVVLHEMVSVGKPVLVSENVGSSSCFTNNGVNGFIFSHKKNNDFKSKMKKIMELSKDELKKMGKESVNLSKRISIESWVQTLNKIYD